MRWIEHWHGSRVHARRVRVLAAAAARLLPRNASVLDIGCGDGQLAAHLAELRTDISVSGTEILPRSNCRIPVTPFDGRRLPFADGSFGATMMVDVLHHANDASALLREAARVAREVVLLKDHYCNGLGAEATLRFMDVVGNRRHNVPLPFKYLTRQQWHQLFVRNGLVVTATDPLARLYPFPASLVFGRNMHFFSTLQRGTTRIESLASDPA